MKRYLVFVQLQTAVNQKNAGVVGQRILASVRSQFDKPEAIFTTEKAFCFAGISGKSASDIFKGMTSGLLVGDLLSVIEVGKDIASVHQGLVQWHSSSRFFTE